MNWKRVFSALLAAVLLVGAGGCEQTVYEQTDSRHTIGVVLKTMDAEHWMEIRSGMEHAAQERDVRLILQYPSDEWAVEEQKVMLRDMAGQQPDAILFAPCDSSDTAWMAELAAEKDIPLFTVDTAASDAEIPYIGSDNRQIGRMAYDYLVSALPEGSRIGVLAGTTKQRSIGDRVSSVSFYCANDAHLTIVSTSSDCKSYTDAYAAARDQIEQDGVDAIFCTSAVIGLGAVGATQELGRPDIRLVAVDTQEDALNAVQVGTLDALIAQSGYDIGYQAVLWACDYLDGKADMQTRYIDNELLTAQNIGAFLQQKEEGQQHEEGSAG